MHSCKNMRHYMCFSFFFFFKVFIFILFWPRSIACGILVPRPGFEPVSPALKAWSLNHWTTREGPVFLFLKKNRLRLTSLTLKKKCLFTIWCSSTQESIQTAGVITKTVRPRIKESGLFCLVYNEKCFTTILFTGLLGTGISLDICC